MDMIINIVYATIATIIIISPFLYYKIVKNRKRQMTLVTARPAPMSSEKKRVVVYNSPPTKKVGNQTAFFSKVK